MQKVRGISYCRFKNCFIQTAEMISEVLPVTQWAHS